MHVKYVALLSGFAIRKIVDKLGHVGDTDQMLHLSKEQKKINGKERNMSEKNKLESKDKSTDRKFNIKDTQKTIHLKPANMTGSSIDMVNSPPHYASSKIECIDAMEAMTSQDREYRTFLSAHEMYCWQVIFKYIWRFPFKSNPLEDLKKAKFYLERLINSIEIKK